MSGIRGRRAPWLSGQCAVLLLALLLCACSRPYATAVSGDDKNAPIAAFAGLKGLLAVHHRVRVLWTHGMGPHGASWVLDRANLVATLLGSTAIFAGEVSAAGSKIEYFTIPSGTDRLTIQFLMYSDLIQKYRDKLSFDAGPSGQPGRFPYQRATLNESLKTGLMNQGLIDAVVYSGRNGDVLRKAFINAVCRIFDGNPDGADECTFGTAEPDDGARVLIAESLGSKMMFDAVEHLALGKSASAGAMRARLARVASVFLVSNQIPLLDQANPSSDPAARPQDDASGSSSLRTFVELASQDHAARGAIGKLNVVFLPTPTTCWATGYPQTISLRDWPG
jgi:hypothetical protein